MRNIDIDAHHDCERHGHVGQPCARCGEGVDYPKRPSECAHDGVISSFVFLTLFADKPGRAMADLRLRCADCGVPYRFLGLRTGASVNQPCVSVGATEVRLPVEVATADNHPLGRPNGRGAS